MSVVSSMVVGAAGCTGADARKIGEFCLDESDCESGLCYDAQCLDPDGDYDRDGIRNGIEKNVTGTDYGVADTDGDGVDDGVEVGSEPAAAADGDGDGIIDALESMLATADPDGDCIPDQYDAENSVYNDDMAAVVRANCNVAGVCGEHQGDITAYCHEGVPTCDYSGVEGYESAETQCDGADNDCDGETDEGLSGPDCPSSRCVPDCGEGFHCDGGSCVADACVPDCTGLVCGPDPICGASCGTCDDGNECTADSCEGGVCSFDVTVGARCDDGNPCTFNDACTAEGTCVGPLPCDDNDICTTDRCDVGVGCVFSPKCPSDGDNCTNEVCDPVTGECSIVPKCDDGNLCTVDQCDLSSGNCTNSPVVCNRSDVCVDGVCGWGSAIYTVECGEDGMCLVPEGPFWMGCNSVVDKNCYSDESPYHQVTLSGYYIDRTEVTVDAYAECVSAGACAVPSTAATYCNWGVAGRGSHPITCVDWNQAGAYCAWAGKRLPTEAEWEKAARGTDGRKYPWGNDAASCDYAVMLNPYAGCGTDSTWDVCSKSPAGDSPYGLCDMAGNAWEWVSDWYAAGYYSSAPTTDPTGPASGTYRVKRGGGFHLGDYSDYVRVSNRLDLMLSDVRDLGFRCARSL